MYVYMQSVISRRGSWVASNKGRREGGRKCTLSDSQEGRKKYDMQYFLISYM